MNTGPYFVMLYHPSCQYVPLMGNDDDIARFESESDAIACADSTSLGEQFGFEVFSMNESL